MSRSRPTASAHPCEIWMKWNGETGTFSFYDKNQEKNIDVGNKFAFVLLDKTATITGWDDKSESAIYSNEVRNTAESPLLVKSFKGGDLANGLYSTVKDTIIAKGGKYTANIYFASSKSSGGHSLCCMQLHGAALSSWMDFEKKNRKAIYEQGIRVSGYDEAIHGKITYRFPVFEISEINEETNQEATKMDAALQDFFDSKMLKPKESVVSEEIPEGMDEPLDYEPVDDLPF